MLPYLGIYATKYTITELKKIIVKSLTATTRRKYLEDSGDDLEDQSDIIELMTQLDKKFWLKKEFAELENKSVNNNNNNNKPGKSQSNGGGGKSDKKKSNPCRKHDGAHEWKDCPDNKSNKSKAKSDKDSKSDKKPKGNLHSTQSTNAPAKKSTPVVGINDKTETKEFDAVLQYDSDDVSAMMVQGDSSRSPPIYNGVTVID